jgi:hypothetical protein
VLIQEYGLFWRADQVDWFPRTGRASGRRQPDGVPRFALLGRQGQRGKSLRVADFYDQRGIYILYGDYGPHYVFRRALGGRTALGLSALGEARSVKRVNKQLMVREMEALLIHAMGLTNITRTRFPEGTEWEQVLQLERELLLARARTRPGQLPTQSRRGYHWK